MGIAEKDVVVNEENNHTTSMNAHYDIQQIANAETAPDGESVVWCGRPDPVRLALTSLPIFFFAIPWTAFALFWMYAASGFNFPPDFSDGGFSFFPLFGLPFVLIGFGMLAAPLFAYTKAYRTIYIVTRKTIRILTLGKTKKVETIAAQNIGRIERREKSDGSGDIIFKEDVTYDSRNKRKTTPVGFYGIPDVRNVEQHIIRLQESTKEQINEKN